MHGSKILSRQSYKDMPLHGSYYPSHKVEVGFGVRPKIAFDWLRVCFLGPTEYVS